jgi:thioredoxin reductase (NADPH)
MASAQRSVLETRYDQMFPILTNAEMTRLCRFGERRDYGPGEHLATTGHVTSGLLVILSGEVEVSQRVGLSSFRSIVTHTRGSFSGELATLAERPALVDVSAKGDVEALAIAPERLRDLLVEEAELGERIMRALILRRVGLLESGGGLIIVGRADQGDVLRLQGFLRRNGQPHQQLDPVSDTDAKELIERFHIKQAQLPIVLCPGGQLLHNPSVHELARCIGLVKPIDPSKVYDAVIIGGGPAGLAAAVYAGSEGLSALVLDCRAFGGQAGASARIENYLGFPTGISGLALMARAFNQAQKFGVEMAIPDEAVRFERHGNGVDTHYLLGLANGERVQARTVVIATGAEYRRLDVENLAEFEGTSVHYWASPLEGRLCGGQEVVIVGGGNSAGQGAVYLAGQAAKVWLLCRGPSLEATMSRYLIDRIAAQPNIEVLNETKVVGLTGEQGVLNSITWRHTRSGNETRRDIRHLFLFIGAQPNTKWLSEAGIALDEKGFVRTDENLGNGGRPLETNFPGVFAIGDVRSGSVKRVAAAVGEGAQVVAALHGVLAKAADTPKVLRQGVNDGG